jgi:hypothetical protein
VPNSTAANDHDSPNSNTKQCAAGKKVSSEASVVIVVVVALIAGDVNTNATDSSSFSFFMMFAIEDPQNIRYSKVEFTVSFLISELTWNQTGLVNSVCDSSWREDRIAHRPSPHQSKLRTQTGF